MSRPARPARLLVVDRYTGGHFRRRVATADATHGLVMEPHEDSAGIDWLEKLRIDVTGEHVDVAVYVAGDPNAKVPRASGYVTLRVHADGTLEVKG